MQLLLRIFWKIDWKLHMIHINRPIKFKKEAECILPNTKDKNIKKQIHILQSLQTENQEIEAELKQKEQNFQLAQQKYFQQFRELNLEKQKLLNKIFIKTVRKQKIMALTDPSISYNIIQKVSNYIVGFSNYLRGRLIDKIGSIKKYKKAKEVVYNMKTVATIRPQIRAIIFKKIYIFWDKQNPSQRIMLCLKKYPLSQNYNLQVFTITGNYYAVQRQLTQDQLRIVFRSQNNENIDMAKNPLEQLVILWKQNKIYLLKEYLKQQDKLKNIEICIKKYKLKLYLQKQRKKMIFFKKVKLTNIFQSIYKQDGFIDTQIDALIIIKDIFKTQDDILNKIKQLKICLSQDFQSELQQKNEQKIKIEKQLYCYQKIYQKVKNEAIEDSELQYSSKYVFFCHTIKSYPSPFQFQIEDKKLLNNFNFDSSSQNYSIKLSQFSQFFQQNFMIQLKPPQTIQISSNYRKKSQYNIFQQDKQQSLKSMHYYQQYIDKLSNTPKIVRIIDFQTKSNLDKVIRLQSYLRMKIKSKQYKELLKKKHRLNFNYSFHTNILLSIIIRHQKVIFFVQCLFLSSQGNRKHKKCLEYPQKYWKLAQLLLAENGKSIIEHCLVWEIQQELKSLFDKKITQYEIQQQRLLAQKPEKFILRITRFFTKILLRKNRQKNIVYIKKLHFNFGNFVLIIRKSKLMKKVYQAQLYPLLGKKSEHTLIKTKNKFQRIYFKDNQIQQFTKKFVTFGKLEDQFYVSEHNFICKPFINKGYRYLQRFGYVKIFSLQMQNQLCNTLKRLQQSQWNQQIKVNYEPRLDMFESQNMVGIIEKKNNNLYRSENPYEKKSQDIRITNLQQIQKNSSSQITQHKPQKILDFTINNNSQIIFYSVFKNPREKSKSQVFYLALFILKNKQGYQYFQEVYRKEMAKRQILQFNYNIIYRNISEWLVLGKKAQKIEHHKSSTLDNLEQSQKKNHLVQNIIGHKKQASLRKFNTTIDKQLKMNSNTIFFRQNSKNIRD